MGRKSVYITLLLFMVLSNVSITFADVHGNSDIPDSELPYYIADVLDKNQHFARQIYNIILAASSAKPSESGTSLDQDTKNNIYNYILDNIPVLLKDDVFQNISHVIFDEMATAYNKSDVSKNITAFQTENGTFTDDAAKNLLKHLDVVRLLQRSMDEGKPVIDKLRGGNDSTVFIAVVNYLIGMTPVVWNDTSFQKIKKIVTDEFSLGYSEFTKSMNISGPELAKHNSTVLVMGVIKYTNLQKMFFDSMTAAKPVIDKIRGKDSTVMLMGLGFLAQEYPIIMADRRYQHVQSVAIRYFSKAFKELNYTMNDLNTKQKEVIQKVLARTNKIQLVQDILRGGSARDVLPLTADDHVNEQCYGDSMDFLDSLVELSPWSIKMFDSMGKLREGVIQGQLNMVGSYDECLSVKAYIKSGTLGNRTKESARSFGTRFCRVSMDIPANVLPVDTKGIPVHLTWGACVPESCHSSDIAGIFRMEAVHNITPTFDNVYVHCFDDRSIADDKAAVAAIVVLSIFAFLILSGTLYVMISKMKLNLGKPDNVYELPVEKKNHAYQFVNKTYKHDSETKVDLSVTNGSSVKLQHIEIPKDYMPHKEGSTNGSVPSNESLSNGNARSEKQTVDKFETKATPTHAKKKEGVIVRILKAFALQENAPRILTGKTGSNSINCLHGIRFFSLTWVILGHTFNYGIVSIPSLWTTENVVVAADMMKRFTFQAVIAGGFAVDTFYMLSGMLLTYLQIKQLEKLAARFKCGPSAAYTFNYYFHRIWRLTPMYMMVLMIYTCLMKYFGDGPLWPSAVKSADDCRMSWWANLLYVNNLVNVDNQCMAWSWFLSNDMQFYVISLFFLVFLAISIPLGVVLICLLMAGGIASAAYEEHIYNGNFFTTKSDNGGYWNNVYITPWCRVSPYCVGLLLGVILYKRPKKPLKTIQAFIGWAIATAVGLALVYGTYSEYKEGGTQWSRDFRSAYESLGRPLWAACVAWVVFACHNGNGGVVDSMLSWHGLVPLSRLSYAAYLVHPMMMMIHVYSKRALVYINDYDIAYLFLGHTCFTFMVAFVVSIAFEAPFMALEKIIMGH